MTTPFLVAPEYPFGIEWAELAYRDTLAAAVGDAADCQAKADADEVGIVWRVFELREPVWTGLPHCARCGAFREVGQDGVCQPCTVDQGWT